jgi:hypothetical protein
VNIGEVHLKMGEYSKALPHFESAVKLGLSSMPENHPDLQLWQKYLELARESYE